MSLGRVPRTILIYPHWHLTNCVSLPQFEEAFNYIANKGYARMGPEEEKEWIELMNIIHDSVKGGMKYNTGTLLMVMTRPVPGEDKGLDPLKGTASSNKGKTPSKGDPNRSQP